jgi:nucleoside-diphosphate-sugar epimerase
MGRGLAAVTGATGFIGRHLVRTLAEDGWRVRVLVRRDPVHALWRGIEPEAVIGALEDDGAVTRLCDGAQVVVHAAGLIKARRPAEFEAVNSAGVRSVARAAGPTAHVLLISSLAARAPQLSPYAASKRAGEEIARELVGPRLTIARPTAVYGPGDRETFGLFRAAATSPILPVFDPAARITLVHVEDLARQVAALAARPAAAETFAICDARPGGYTWRELMTAAARACGRSPRLVRIPGGLVTALAAATSTVQRAAGATPMLTFSKARELLHPDWSIASEASAAGLSSPRHTLDEGLRVTADWYREVGWLPRISRQFGDGIATGL